MVSSSDDLSSSSSSEVRRRTQRSSLDLSESVSFASSQVRVCFSKCKVTSSSLEAWASHKLHPPQPHSSSASVFLNALPQPLKPHRKVFRCLRTARLINSSLDHRLACEEALVLNRSARSLLLGLRRLHECLLQERGGGLNILHAHPSVLWQAVLQGWLCEVGARCSNCPKAFKYQVRPERPQPDIPPALLDVALGEGVGLDLFDDIDEILGREVDSFVEGFDHRVQCSIIQTLPEGRQQDIVQGLHK
mmetsp:Transcript_18361/g.46187  ORF Transcript_18361/g.46187 Transcript_18361/m.46187 type:complete len:248 (-) Transcript_18361:420-1163(-)